MNTTLTHPELLNILSTLNYSDDVISAGLGIRNFGTVKFAKKGDQQALDELNEVLTISITDLKTLSAIEGFQMFCIKSGVDREVLTNAIDNHSFIDLFKCLIGWKNHITFASHRTHLPHIVKNLEEVFGYSFTIQTASEISSLSMGLASFHKDFDDGVSLLVRFSYQGLVLMFSNANGKIISHFEFYISLHSVTDEDHYCNQMEMVAQTAVNIIRQIFERPHYVA